MANSDRTNRAATGIQGLDDIIGGGFPRDRFYLIQGEPGCGKTTLALRFLIDGREQGERGLYITLSETKEELNAVADSHGWSLAGIDVLELSAIESKLGNEAANTIFHPAEVELNFVTKVLLEELDRVKAQRVVLDSLSEMRLLTQSALRYRRQMLAFKHHFARNRATVMLLDDMPSDNQDRDVQSLVHGVVELEQMSPLYGAERRRVRIIKLRGAAFRGGYHDFVIRRGGLTVFPRLSAVEHAPSFATDVVSTGLSEFDRLLGGGLHRGTSTLLMGPAGCGKSTLGARITAASCERGERCTVFLFDEILHNYLSRSKALGMDLQQYRDQDLVRIHQIDPAELSPGEFAHMIYREVDERGVRMVAIDSLNGYINAMPGEKLMALHLHELLTYLNQQGVISIMTLAQHGMLGQVQSPIDVTYVADSVLYLRYFENAGTVRQAISVIKKRSGNHERSIRELQITGEGVRLGAPLVEFDGVLTGTPVYHGPVGSMLPQNGNGSGNGHH
jgi:circadian clock protein KaiC